MSDSLIKQKGKVITKKVNSFLISYFKLFVVISVVIIFTSGVFLIIIPKYRATLNSIKDISLNEKYKYNKRIKDLEDLRTLLKNYNSISAKDVIKMNNVIPPKYRKEDVFLMIKDLIEKNNLLVTSIDVRDAESLKSSEVERSVEKKKIKESGVGLMNINVTVNGINYDSFLNILKVFETSAPLIDVKSFSFLPTSEDETKTATFVMTMYYFDK